MHGQCTFLADTNNAGPPRRCEPVRRLLKTVTTAATFLAIGLGASVVSTGCSEAPQIGPLRGSGYMLTYEESQTLGYDVAWQTSVARSFFGNAEGVIPGEDYIITYEDGSNIISVISNRDGTPVWQKPVGDRLERLLGVAREGGTVIAATQSDLYILDIANGRQIADQRYGRENIASSTPLILGREAVYGSNDGRVVYHDLNTGLMRGAYRLGTGVDMTPIWVGGNSVIVITRTGRIHLIDIATNTRFWQAGVLDPFESKPALGDTGLFIAGQDQSIWAFRLSDGRQMWRTRFQYPLRDDPKLVGDTLYQAVPNQGFAALNATTGQIIWQNPEVAGGTLITRNNGDLIIWDRDDGADAYGSTFYRIDASTGDVIGKVHSAWISRAAASSMEDGDIYGLSRAGRIIKLVP